MVVAVAVVVAMVVVVVVVLLLTRYFVVVLYPLSPLLLLLLQRCTVVTDTETFEQAACCHRCPWRLLRNAWLPLSYAWNHMPVCPSTLLPMSGLRNLCPCRNVSYATCYVQNTYRYLVHTF